MDFSHRVLWHANISKRAESWGLLTRINQGIDAHCCVIGGFNKITTQDKKLGSKMRTLRQMEEFRMTLERNDLLDLRWKNFKFTWSNRHQDESFTKERLDRVMVNNLWLNEFRSMGVEVLNSGRSDHHPILLTTTKTFNHGITKRRIFRYEAKWTREDDWEHPIQMVWQKHVVSLNC